MTEEEETFNRLVKLPYRQALMHFFRYVHSNMLAGRTLDVAENNEDFYKSTGWTVPEIISRYTCPLTGIAIEYPTED